MSDSENEETLSELDDSNFELVDTSSNRLVFKLVNTLGDASIALANVHIMIRGEDENSFKVNCALLAAECSHGCVLLGIARQESRDVRVLRVQEWTRHIPLPLGGDFQKKIRIILHTSEPLDPSLVKFGADLVMTPDAYVEDDARVKRDICQSTFRVRGGTPMSVENGKNALSTQLETFPTLVTFFSKDAPQIPSSSASSWLDYVPISSKYTKPRPIC